MKKYDEKAIKSNSAITLIALIITIIVLLILAGVTLSMVMGESGIFSKANNASEQTKISNAKEIIRMQVLENELNKKTKDANAKSDEDLQVDVETKLTEEGYKIENGKIKIGDTEINIAEEIANASSGETIEITIADGDNTQGTEPKTIDGEKATYKNPIIPAGFKAVDNSIDNTIDSNASWTNGEGYKYGLVIQDKEGNQLVWIAVDGTYITSPYGNRLHPIQGVYRYHDGIDIGNAGFGAPVVAAADGIVTYAGVMSGYGNCVMINHGDGIVTLYGHGQEIYTELGATVKQGDVIMAVGSTGNSTGPHLHFEVRKFGVAVDPIPYLQGDNANNNTIENENVNNNQTINDT